MTWFLTWMVIIESRVSPNWRIGTTRDHGLARSRARVAMGLLLTAPGVPMIFMGQEFLEDKLWSDNPNRSDVFLWWDGHRAPIRTW